MKYRLFVATLIIIVGIAVFLIHQVAAQPTPSEEATYSDDFSSYTPGSPPSGWLLRGPDKVIPIVKDVAGTGPSYRLVDFPEVPWQYWDMWLLKDGVIPHAPYTVTVKINFQNKVADRAGLTIAWNDTNRNRIDIQPNVYGNDIELRPTYNGPIQSNVIVSEAAHIPINPFTDYWLRVVVKDDGPGQGQLSVLWSTDGTTFRQVMSATGLQDLRGLVGVSTAGPHLPHVYFDDFVVSAPTVSRPFQTDTAKRFIDLVSQVVSVSNATCDIIQCKETLKFPVGIADLTFGYIGLAEADALSAELDKSRAALDLAIKQYGHNSPQACTAAQHADTAQHRLHRKLIDILPLVSLIFPLPLGDDVVPECKLWTMQR